MTAALHAEPTEEGWHLTCRRRRGWLRRAAPAPVSDWPALVGDPLLAETIAEAEAEGWIERSPEHLLLSHDGALGFSRAMADRLGLPRTAPYGFALKGRGAVKDPAFHLSLSWVDSRGGVLWGLRRIGSSALQHRDHDYLLSAAQAGILDAFKAFEADLATLPPDPVEARNLRMAAVARFKQIVEAAGVKAEMDAYLLGLEIRFATGFTLERQMERAGTEQIFMPRLQTRHRQTRWQAGLDQEAMVETEEWSDLLEGAEHAGLQNEFRKGARSAWVVPGRAGGQVYVVLDRPVAEALKVVAAVNASDAATRQRFYEDPQGFLLPAVEQAGGSLDLLAGLDGFGDRVIGQALAEAASGSVGRVDGAGLLPGWEGATLPGETAGPMAPGAEPPVEAPEPVGGRMILLDAPGYEANRRVVRPLSQPPMGGTQPLPGLRTRLKPHQETALAWLIQARNAGYPAVLLADDMGLGKTLQVLAFLKTWQGSTVPPEEPVLIVAPVTLLETWKEQIQEHLDHAGLGALALLHGASLREYRLVAGGLNDTQLAQQTLDLQRLRQHKVVLTNYETLRDYQQSLAAIRFSVVVLDEAQKVKTPTALITRAARALQAGFTILMTGTPIENSLSDLWSLWDVAWPGLLHPLPEFQSRYAATNGALSGLRAAMTGEAPGEPRLMLRRFKRDAAPDLPEKREAAIRKMMPPVQQQAVDAAYARSRGEAVGDALAAIQRLRGVCLHPHLGLPLPEDRAGIEALIKGSARIEALIEILDQARRAQEAVLIFVDLRDGQKLVQWLLRRRFGLSAPEPGIINGETAQDKRRQIRERFQAGSGFGALVLSPRAAGMGLTLTRATQVVHLSRWWNPAVEDQCSDRVYRIGQTRPVTIHIPIAVHPRLGEDSFDCRLDALLRRKRDLSQDVIAHSEPSIEELRALLA